MLISQTAGIERGADPAKAALLVGDVGGTNCRLALAQGSTAASVLADPKTYKVADFPTAEAAIDHFLREVGWHDEIDAAVIAIAGPVKNGVVQSTNMPWRMSEDGLRKFGADRVKLINDYTAVALSVEHLTGGDTQAIGPDIQGDPTDSVALIGAGTGFGAGAFARGVGGHAAIATEGGHISFAPVDELEIEILRVLMRRFGRVSVERILSGPGLVNLHTALAEIEGVAAKHLEPEDIVRGAEAGEALCTRTLARFNAIYGSVAGDFALAYGARGGVYLGGGIAPKIAPHLLKSQFRARFEEKGRFQPYLAAIPTRIIVNPYAALLGAVFLAASMTQVGDLAPLKS